MSKSISLVGLLLVAVGSIAPRTAEAITPSGGWTLLAPSLEVKDHFFRVDVDPGEAYPNAGYAPSSVYHAQYIEFASGDIGYLGLQRGNGAKRAIVSIWRRDRCEGRSSDAGGELLRVRLVRQHQGPLQLDRWGIKYRFRVEHSPRTASDSTGDWWMVTLADLTSDTIDVLGEMKTPRWGGLARGNGSFLEYFHGPYECQTLRHSRATLGAIQGDYGTQTTLLNSNGSSYAEPDVCGAAYVLPAMTASDYELVVVGRERDPDAFMGNQYRGIHNWDSYGQNAKTGMFFVADQNADEPYVYQARHDGKFWYFPAAGTDNVDWKSIGRGYPIINDLYFRNQRLYGWDERNASYVNVGDFFGVPEPVRRRSGVLQAFAQAGGLLPDRPLEQCGLVLRWSSLSEERQLPSHWRCTPGQAPGSARRVGFTSIRVIPQCISV